jgi:flagellar biosynthetic protein FlhB
MAEDNGDKTEAPTPRKRQEAREQGNIARSPDLTAAVLLLGVMLLLKWYGPGVMEAMKSLMLEMLSGASLGDLGTGQLGKGLVRATVQAGKAVAPLFAGLMLIAVLVNILQVGLFFSTKRLQPNLAALNPMQGVGRLFKGGNGVVKLLMGLAKLALVTLVAYSAVHSHLGQIVTAQQLSFVQIFGLGGEVVYSIGMRIGVVLLILALADYLWQRFRIEKELKMTKQEVKEEMKRMEGDPHIKQRRRQIQVQVATQRMKQAVPTADVVVTNPTEFAIALKYDAATMHAPKVVAKGRGFMAARIREMAVAHGVPILERKPLARALYKLVDVGQEVPEQFYSAVAEILAYVYELSGTLRRKRSA